MIAMLAVGLALAGPRSMEHPSVRPFGTGSQVYVVSVGISNFKNLDRADDLHYADSDAQDLANLLYEVTDGALNLDNLHVLTNSRAGLEEVRGALAEALSAADDDDLVVIFLSTHGVLEGDEGYFLTWDSTPDERLPYTSLPVRELDGMIGRSRAKHVLLFVDACHSGVTGYSGTKELSPNAINSVVASIQTSSTSLFKQSSSLVLQQSVEGKEYCGGHGAYTCALMQALEGEADENGDGLISLGELAVEVPPLVSKLTTGGQVPETKGRYDSQLTIAAVPAVRRWWDGKPPAAVARPSQQAHFVPQETEESDAQRGQIQGTQDDSRRASKNGTAGGDAPRSSHARPTLLIETRDGVFGGTFFEGAHSAALGPAGGLDLAVALPVGGALRLTGSAGYRLGTLPPLPWDEAGWAGSGPLHSADLTLGFALSLGRFDLGISALSTLGAGRLSAGLFNESAERQESIDATGRVGRMFASGALVSVGLEPAKSRTTWLSPGLYGAASTDLEVLYFGFGAQLAFAIQLGHAETTEP